MAKAETRALTLVSQVKRALARASTLEDVKRIRDEAEAVRSLAQKAKLGLEVQNQAAEFKLRAERKAGELLSALTRRGRRGTQMYQPGTFRLEELGISRNQSSRWQREAAISEAEFEAFVRATHDAGKEVSAEGLLRLRRPRQRNGANRKNASRQDDRSSAPPNHLAGAEEADLRERVAELINHQSLLGSMLLPFLEQQQASLAPSARRHSARLLRDVSLLLAELEARLARKPRALPRTLEMDNNEV